jgi:hypothetical protein
VWKMKRLEQLTALGVRRAGLSWHNDGGNLYLRVDEHNNRY